VSWLEERSARWERQAAFERSQPIEQSRPELGAKENESSASAFLGSLVPPNFLYRVHPNVTVLSAFFMSISWRYCENSKNGRGVK
jgi:hypothetical protein